MGRLTSTLAGFVVALALFFAFAPTDQARADHNIVLPLVPDTPAIHNIMDWGGLTYCLDPEASAYPGFRDQLRDVYAVDYLYTGVVMWEMSQTPNTLADAQAIGCNVWHNGRYDNFCNGCAANIYYASWPVTVNYKLSLGYVNWKSAQGHEHGHLLGLHEQYIDSGGTIGCTYRPWTVMSCGSPFVEYLQARDIAYVHSWMLPPAVGGAWMGQHPDGSYYVWWCGTDPHSKRSNRISIMYASPGSWGWSGHSFAKTAGCTGALVDYAPGRCVYINQENSKWWDSFTLLWWARNDTLAGCMV
jgi:hypothetical protein